MNKKLIISNIFLILLMLCTSVYAAINANLNLKTQTTTVEVGEEFTVTLSLKDLEGVTDGVDSIQGYINIDENVLEKISFDSIVKESNKVKIGNETVSVYDVNTLDTIEDYGLFFNDKVEGNDYKIVIDLKNKVKTEDLVSIKFKVKQDIKAGNYSDIIKYEMFTITEGIIGQSVNLSKSLGINIINSTIDNTNTNVNKNTNTNKNTNKNTNINTNKNTNINKNTNTNTNKNVNINKNKVQISNKIDNTVTNKIIPAAGESTGITLLKVIVVVTIVGFAIYVKNKKYKEI